MGDVQERIERDQFDDCISGNRRAGPTCKDATLNVSAVKGVE
jgi:hypothetical protein